MSKFGIQGDSITKGTDYGGVTSADTYVRIIGTHLGYSTENIINAGVSARTVVQMALDFKSDIIDQGVTVCGVMGYFNDFQQNVSIEDFEVALHSIAEQAAAANVKLTFITPPIWRGNESDHTARRPFLWAMERVAAQVACDFIDVTRHCAYDYLCNTALFDSWYAPGDLMHQSKNGHVHIAGILASQCYSRCWEPLSYPSIEALTLACADYLIGGQTPELMESVQSERNKFS